MGAVGTVVAVFVSGALIVKDGETSMEADVGGASILGAFGAGISATVVSAEVVRRVTTDGNNFLGGAGLASVDLGKTFGAEPAAAFAERFVLGVDFAGGDLTSSDLGFSANGGRNTLSCTDRSRFTVPLFPP